MLYSPVTNGFYDQTLHSEVPADSRYVSEEVWRELMSEQVSGACIKPDSDGNPVAIHPKPLSSSQLQILKLAEINDKYESLVKLFAVDVPFSEKLIWYQLEAEARGLHVDPNTPATTLRTLSEQRGVPLDVLVAKVMEKAEIFSAYIGKITGIRQRLEAQLRAIDLDAADAVQLIDAVQWPNA